MPGQNNNNLLSFSPRNWPILWAVFPKAVEFSRLFPWHCGLLIHPGAPLGPSSVTWGGRMSFSRWNTTVSWWVERLSGPRGPVVSMAKCLLLWGPFNSDSQLPWCLCWGKSLSPMETNGLLRPCHLLWGICFVHATWPSRPLSGAERS